FIEIFMKNFCLVKAAKALGISNTRIMFKHILPNALVASITFIPFIMSEAVISLTALDFLGLGLSQDYPSLGDLVRQGKDNLQAPWIGISIFLVLSSLLTMLIFIGEGIRDAFDARRIK
ncbi:MAG: ABC transporter permease subunit, partial [Alphaproteobacteria bacterium]|nr:ABC transporter permease subunit [Alphaproteobacteria bacterium]